MMIEVIDIPNDASRFLSYYIRNFLHLSRAIIFAGCFLIASSNQATAEADDLLFVFQDLGWATPIRSKKVQVKIIDSVSGKCWTDTKKAKTAVSLEMVRSGLIVGEEGPTTISINSVGFRLANGVCIAHLSFDVYIGGIDRRVEPEKDSKSTAISIISRIIFRKGLILSGGTDMSERLTTEAANFSREYLVELANRKSQIMKEFEDSNNPDAQIWIKWLTSAD